MEKSITYQNPS